MALIGFDSIEDIEREYQCKLADDTDVIIAWYLYGSYEGRSFVLFRQQGKLYEVNGYHCSCYGLEGQWLPEETTVKALRMRQMLDASQDYYYGGGKEARNVLNRILDGMNVELEED